MPLLLGLRRGILSERVNSQPWVHTTDFEGLGIFLIPHTIKKILRKEDIFYSEYNILDIFSNIFISLLYKV